MFFVNNTKDKSWLKNECRWPLALMLLAFAGVWYLSYLTPMHSDDFFYMLNGFGLTAHISHYMGWSGRFVADYLSPLILNVQPKILQSLIQACGLFAIMAAVVRSVCLWAPGLEGARRAWLAGLVVLLFLLSMPSFGQAFMWVVGSANYMWPAVFYSWTICLLLGYMQTRRIPWYAWPLAVLAGCSNENIALAMIGFAALVLVWQYWLDRRLDWRLLLLFALLCLGAAVLLAAPGNYARLAGPANDTWRALSGWEKFWLHMTDRIDWNYHKSKLAYLLCFGLVAWQFLPSRRRSLWDADRQMPSHFGLAVLFMLMSFGASFVMVFSPTVMPRNMTGAFVLTVFSVAFAVRSLLDGTRAYYRLRQLVRFLSLVLLVVAINVVPVYQALAVQAEMRHGWIATAASEQELILPDYYSAWLISSSYRKANSPGEIASYFHLDSLEVVLPEFDYSVTLEPGVPFTGNTGGIQVEALWAYPEKYGLDTVLFVAIPGRHDTDSAKHLLVRVQNSFDKELVARLKSPVYFNGRTYLHARVAMPRMFITGYELDVP